MLRPSFSSATPLPGSKNVRLSVNLDESKLYIYCDLSQDFGTSSSGKSVVVASSGGNKPLGATNAFVGLNLFCKDAKKRDLDENATLELREMTTMGNYCQWHVEGNILCIMIDFNDVGEKVATSGKSVLLASSGGNKQIGKTGIMCGMNCYVPLGKKLLLDNLSTVAKNAAVAVGDKVNLGDGFSLTVESDTRVIVHYESGVKDGTGIKTMPLFNLNGQMSISFSIKTNSKKIKTEENTTKQGNGNFTAPSPKAKNLLVNCRNNNVDANSTVDIDICFDPTQNFGRSSSGKSITVASSGGWCEIGSGFAVNFNAYKPAPPLTSAEITEAVNSTLSLHSKEKVAGLSFNSVMAEVASMLGMKESEIEETKEQVKEIVKQYLKSLT